MEVKVKLKSITLSVPLKAETNIAKGMQTQKSEKTAFAYTLIKPAHSAELSHTQTHSSWSTDKCGRIIPQYSERGSCRQQYMKGSNNETSAFTAYHNFLKTATKTYFF